MKIISEANQTVLTEYGSYRLKYELLESEFCDEGESEVLYGIRICQIDERTDSLYDVCQIRGFTDEKDTAAIFFGRIVEGLAMPVSLPDLIEDWHSAMAVL